MTDTPVEEPAVPDGPDFRKDGTTLVFIDGAQHRLRRPKYGEFKRLRALLEDVQDETLRLTQKATEGRPEKPADNAPNEERTAYALAVRSSTRELTDGIEELNIRWVRAVFNGDEEHRLTGLSTPHLPDDSDDWPSWLIAGKFVTDLVNHWRAVPLARGAS